MEFIKTAPVEINQYIDTFVEHDPARDRAINKQLHAQNEMRFWESVVKKSISKDDMKRVGAASGRELGILLKARSNNKGVYAPLAWRLLTQDSDAFTYAVHLLQANAGSPPDYKVDDLIKVLEANREYPWMSSAILEELMYYVYDSVTKTSAVKMLDFIARWQDALRQGEPAQI